jgi:hypothetical protein
MFLQVFSDAPIRYLVHLTEGCGLEAHVTLLFSVSECGILFKTGHIVFTCMGVMC